MKQIKCSLPAHLNENNLSTKIKLHSEIIDSKAVVTSIIFQKKKWNISELKEYEIFFNWKKVICFDSAGLLSLLTVQHSLLISDVSISNFGENKILGCNEYVLRALSTYGYFTQLLSGIFTISTREKYLINLIDPWENIPPLQNQNEILPIVTCQSPNNILRGSPEDQIIKEYEESTSVQMFIDQDKKYWKKRKIIANGEFGYLIIRQCRKNIIEHSNSDIAFTTAQIHRKKDIKSIWGKASFSLERMIDKNLNRIMDQYPDDMPILDLYTIDNGVGIIETLRDTWGNHLKYGQKKIDAYLRVNKKTKGWKSNEKVIEFSMDEEGSSKVESTRSEESPGLYKIDKLISKENGIFEISSNLSRVTHFSNEKIAPSKSFSPLSHGTAVRILLPLIESKVNNNERGHFYSVQEKLTKTSQLETPEEIIDLYDKWNKIIAEPENIKKSIDDFVNSLIEEMQELNKTNLKVLLLNWENLPWEDHHMSNFLVSLLNRQRKKEISKPIIHINMPTESLILCKEAVSAYSTTPKILTLLFFKGNMKWRWIGLNESYINTSFEKDKIVGILNKIIKNSKPISLKEYDENTKNIIYNYLNRSNLFIEETGKASDGSEQFLARYSPTVTLPEIMGKIASTFNNQLSQAVESKFCKRTPDNLPSPPPNIKHPLIQLTNSKYVSEFYRCDGLLNYSPYSDAKNRSIINSTF